MPGLVIDARRIKALARLEELIAYTGQTKELQDELWSGLMQDDELFWEFVYYLDHHSILDHYRCGEYGLTDVYFWCLNQYKLKRDIGKIPMESDNEAVVLEAFFHILRMKDDPDTYRKWLSSGRGLDIH